MPTPCPACGSTRFEPIEWSQDAVVSAIDGSLPTAGTSGLRCAECGALIPKASPIRKTAERRPQRAKSRSRKPAAKAAAKKRATTSTSKRRR